MLEGLDGFRGDSSVSTWIYSITRRVVSRYAHAQRTYSTRLLSAFFEGEEEPQMPAGTDVEHPLALLEHEREERGNPPAR